MTVIVGLEPLTRAQLVAVTREHEPVELSAEVVDRLDRQRVAIDTLSDSGEAIYGLSTGFGSLATTSISPDERRDLQRSLIRSHAAGIGPEVENEVVRAMMVSRLTNLCSGVSGVRSSTALAYAALLNANITPIVQEFGSLGCSGDLAPLASVALALMGEGDVRDAGGARRVGAVVLGSDDLGRRTADGGIGIGILVAGAGGDSDFRAIARQRLRHVFVGGSDAGTLRIELGVILIGAHQRSLNGIGEDRLRTRIC